MPTYKLKATNGVQNEAVDVDKLRNTLIRADNVIIGDQGELIRRPALSPDVYGSGVDSSLYAPTNNTARMFVVENMRLKVIDPNESMETLTLLDSEDPISYTTVPNTDAVYACSIATLLQIHPHGSIHKAIPLPDLDGILADYAAGDGFLPKGKYFVATAFRDMATGDTGGAVQLEFPIVVQADNGRITIAPTVQPEAAGFLRVYYCTTPDGEILYEAASVLGSALTTLYHPAIGRPCDTLHLSPMLPGAFVEYVGGRLVTARDNFITYSAAFKPLLTDPALNWISVTGRVRFMKRVGDVLFYGDDRGVMSISNLGEESMTQREVTLDPPLYNSAVSLPNGSKLGSADTNNPADQPMIMWLGSRGAYVGLPNGLAAKVHSNTLLDNKASVLAAAELELRGVRFVVFAHTDHCLVVNSTTGAISHFPDLILTGVTRFRDVNWVSSATGGVRKLNYYSSLEPVPAVIEFGYTGFGLDEEKRVDNVWVSSRAGRNLVLGLSVLGDSLPEQSYNLQTENTDVLRNSRFVPGKGMLGRYWKLRITDNLGDFQIYSISVDVTPSKRRR